MATQFFQYPTSCEMYISMLTCMLSVVDLGINPMVEDHPVPALWEHSNSDWTQSSPSGNHSPTSYSEQILIQHVHHNVLIDGSCHIFVL